MCTEIQAKTMLSYTEVTKVTSHAMFSQWTGFLEVEDLVSRQLCSSFTLCIIYLGA